MKPHHLANVDLVRRRECHLLQIVRRRSPQIIVYREVRASLSLDLKVLLNLQRVDAD